MLAAKLVNCCLLVNPRPRDEVLTAKLRASKPWGPRQREADEGEDADEGLAKVIPPEARRKGDPPEARRPVCLQGSVATEMGEDQRHSMVRLVLA